MVIGNGSIAKILQGHDREGAIFFASGVSNSACENDAEFEREERLLAYQDWSKCIFYFSTISIYIKDTPYTRHKREMERTISALFENYNIVRLGNIEGDTNPYTFLNYIRAQKAKGEPVEIRDEFKFMISKEQLLLVTDNLPLIGKNEISIFGRMAKVKDLI